MICIGIDISVDAYDQKRFCHAAAESTTVCLRSINEGEYVTHHYQNTTMMTHDDLEKGLPLL